MSLATRCTACGTAFRVVQDQLKVSEGWVRCGRCNEVFNAIEGLFDLDRDAAPDRPPPKSQQEEPSPGANEHGAADDVPWAPDPSLVDRIDAQLLSSHRSPGGPPAAAHVDEPGGRGFSDARLDPELLTGESGAQEPWIAPSLASEASSVVRKRAAAPEFVRHAQRQARWRSPGTRAALGAAALLLAVALVLQGGHHFLDLIAARWPVLMPALTTWCNVASCSIESPRRIEDMFVESSALTRAMEVDGFKLSVTLRNRGSMTVALPSVDLSLTDPAGQLVARRVLTPRDFRAPSALVAPGADVALQLVMATGSSQVTGYTVEIFYP
jgi:predicted Zn finger-like uncharacterized protein